MDYLITINDISKQIVKGVTLIKVNGDVVIMYKEDEIVFISNLNKIDSIIKY